MTRGRAVLVLQLVLVSVLVPRGSALKCYQCSTQSEPDCADPFLISPPPCTHSDPRGARAAPSGQGRSGDNTDDLEVDHKDDREADHKDNREADHKDDRKVDHKDNLEVDHKNDRSVERFLESCPQDGRDYFCVKTRQEEMGAVLVTRGCAWEQQDRQDNCTTEQWADSDYVSAVCSCATEACNPAHQPLPSMLRTTLPASILLLLLASSC
jgi:hypothetical protein